MRNPSRAECSLMETMMRTLTTLAAMAIAVGAAGAAVAQPAPQPGAPEPGPMGEGGMHGHAQMHGGMGGMGGMRPGMMGMMRPSKGARFHFSRNDGVVDVKCAEDEPMRACVDAASALLDKLAGQQPK
jgi:hypothetical protein